MHAGDWVGVGIFLVLVFALLERAVGLRTVLWMLSPVHRRRRDNDDGLPPG